MNRIKQVLFITSELHKQYNEDFIEEPMNFEAFINFMLGQLYDDDKTVESIRFSEDLSACVIIYTMKL